MPPRFNQNGVSYVYIFRFCEVTAFSYINRLFLKVVLLLMFKEKIFTNDYLFSLQ